MTHIKRTYAALGRLSHKVITPFMKLYMNEKHVRARVLIFDESQEILLVRNWLGHQQWTLPGGGVHRTETPAEAAAREVYEETGLRIAHDQLQELGVFPNESTLRYTYTVACYFIQIAKRQPHIARRRHLEMLDMAWFKRDNLPKDVSPTVLKALELQKAR